jgi:hypothetical protein
MFPIPFIPLYAETHFRFFRLFPSLLYKKIPEVLFDLPRRLSPGKDLPVVLILNDIDRFPTECKEVKIVVSQKNMSPILFQFIDLQKNIIEHPFSFQSKVFVFFIPRIKLKNGLCHINCSVNIKTGKKPQTIINDNLTTSSKLPFSCFIADEALPGNECCSYGDLHVHSHFSQSHVEFGPPVQIIDLFTTSYGADFSTVTDHSYDLECSMDNYLLPDPTLQRWKLLKNEISKKSIVNTFVLGEEISCLNSKSNAVHLCGFGLEEYIPGAIDGARKKKPFRQQLSISETISLLHKQEGVAFAAHPGSSPGFMQRLFLKRGKWTCKDLSDDIDGIQAINNGFGISWQRAKVLWVKELLKGKKLSLIAGNDCHGDFNRYRYLSIPFISIKEIFNRYFCSSMTGTYEKIKTQKQLIEILKNGRTFVTTGPMLCLSSSDSIKDCIIGNNINNFNKEYLTIIIKSTYEFGTPQCVKLFLGIFSDKNEKIHFLKHLKNDGLNVTIQVPISSIRGKKGYLRAEAECITQDGTMHYSATSPYYF